jgi:hypothetical protein
MSENLLQQIQRLQFDARGEAETLLLAFVRERFPDLGVVSLTLRPQAISLNSFNGFLETSEGARLFYKTHIEQDNVVSEFYNAGLLAEAGYPVLLPLYSSTHSGQQLLIYPVVEAPSVFDLARALEQSPELASVSLTSLANAQQTSDDALAKLHRSTLANQQADAHAVAPIHQLFYHRLTAGRLARFYADELLLSLPGFQTSWAQAKHTRWHINGRDYSATLGDLIADAIDILNPRQAGPAVTGHGDAHNGNVFFTGDDMMYFDPAFAGRHDPLLDLVKPIFHNVFAMWMYFPGEERDALTLTTDFSNPEVWTIEHSYTLNLVRRMFLESKVERSLIPTLRLLKSQDMLRPDWRRYLKLALMCCPLLTLNLNNFPSEITALGLSMVIEMGADSSSGSTSVIDQMLDLAQASLA